MAVMGVLAHLKSPSAGLFCGQAGRGGKVGGSGGGGGGSGRSAYPCIYGYHPPL